MTMTFYIINSLHKNTDGTIEQVETTRGTPQGLKNYLDRLRDDSTCITFNIAEQQYGTALKGAM